MSIATILSTLALLAAAQAAEPLTVTGTDQVDTLPCDGRVVTITGVDNAITLTGVCKSVTVSGSGNTVTAAIAPGGVLVVSGTDQKVRWRSTGEVRRQVSGVDNQVTKVGP